MHKNGRDSRRARESCSTKSPSSIKNGDMKNRSKGKEGEFWLLQPTQTSPLALLPIKALLQATP